MPKYTLEAGRAIRRDGQPFVHLWRSQLDPLTDGFAFSPTDADAFARFVVRAGNSHDELVRAVEWLLDDLKALGFGPDEPISGADLTQTISGHFENLCSAFDATRPTGFENGEVHK